MCSSTKEVLPVVLLDAVKVGADGTPGPMFARMYAWYQTFKATVMRAG
jgi:branched-subunit amino acid aminotransferase/4-amino-4-deoxychorismate lyase